MAVTTTGKQGHATAIALQTRIQRQKNNSNVAVRCITGIAMRHVQQGLLLLSAASQDMPLIWTETMTVSAVSELTRENELWGMALWVEKKHGADGWLHIAEQQDRLLAKGDPAGVTLWQKVGERFDELRAPPPIDKAH